MGLRALVKTYPIWINLDQSGSNWINHDPVSFARPFWKAYL
jgi:hypothetical protein